MGRLAWLLGERWYWRSFAILKFSGQTAPALSMGYLDVENSSICPGSSPKSGHCSKKSVRFFAQPIGICYPSMHSAEIVSMNNPDVQT